MLNFKNLKRELKYYYWKSRLSYLGPRTEISLGVRIQDAQQISIGTDCFISHGVYLFGNTSPPQMLRVGDRTTIREGAYLAVTDGEISIGNDCFIGPRSVIYGNGNVFIGNHVLIAAHTCIASINHRFDRLKPPIAEQGLDCRPVIIEDNVWLGLQSTIVPGVRIGTGSIIAAGTTVYRDIPPYSIAYGSPLRIKPRQSQNTDTSPESTEELLYA